MADRLDKLLTVEQAAERLALKPSTLYAWSYERRIPTIKLGRSLRFKESDIQKLIKRSERPALRENPLTNS